MGWISEFCFAATQTLLQNGKITLTNFMVIANGSLSLNG